MKLLSTLFSILFCLSLSAQSSLIRGQLQDAEGGPISFGTISLHDASDSSLVKVETSDDSGIFNINGIDPGTYFLVASFVGLPDLRRNDINLIDKQTLDLKVLVFDPANTTLDEVTVSAERPMVEVKPDRTVFNVEGTINSTGSDALSLLRKAPAVMVDNNNNISVLGRSGVLIYIDGKRLPISGEDLVSYLENLPAEQIDRIDVITNPGAKYEAEGNAGILDIRLKRNENYGANGSVNASYSQGHYDHQNLSASGNYRDKLINVFLNGGTGQGTSFNDMTFLSRANGLEMAELNNHDNDWQYYNLRLGTDFFLSNQHTVGFLVSRRSSDGDRESFNRIEIAKQITPENIDSILVARNFSDHERSQQTYNINYQFDNANGRSVNIDLDYGRYENRSDRRNSNRYYDANEEVLLTEVINTFDTPSDIDIYTFKVDFEDKLFGGTFGVGTKLSRVISDNTFLFYNEIASEQTLNNRRSNIFEYEENVYAGYISYIRPLGKQWNLSLGLRAEQTDATGDLQAFLPELMEEPVNFNYLSWFPNAGLTWQISQKQVLALNYGRRINRPDYNVLNPFENQISELSFEKGNAFLRPEIVNNLELGYTLNYRYNFKLAYSLTTDQITRLIAPDEEDPRAGFITWENLAEQTVISFNASAPIQVAKGWNMYVNLSGSYLDNQADYGDGAIVDVQAFTYSIYQQSTFNLPAKIKGEISGYFSGPGIWGGVFEYESQWSLNAGLQRRFLQDKLNVRVNVNDIFYQTGWDGFSFFDGLYAEGRGRWDSRRVNLSVGYNFGNQKVKSRKRKTGLEEEADRIGDGN